eukprot:PhF_6_TR1420/c0_g1_i2/m.2492
MSTPTTLRAAVGLPTTPPSLHSSALIIVDAQNTYTEGPLELWNVQAAIVEIGKLLKRARALKIPVVHVQHDCGAGTLYDVKGHSGAIVPALTPLDSEKIVVKAFPSSFEQTDLGAYLESTGVKNLVIVGFMTHCCINSTARVAFNKGYLATVVANATSTRSLPNADGNGGVVEAQDLHRSSLAAISDLHCVVVPNGESIQDQ